MYLVISLTLTESLHDGKFLQNKRYLIASLKLNFLICVKVPCEPTSLEGVHLFWTKNVWTKIGLSRLHRHLQTK